MMVTSVTIIKLLHGSTSVGRDVVVTNETCRSTPTVIFIEPTRRGAFVGNHLSSMQTLSPEDPNVWGDMHETLTS